MGSMVGGSQVVRLGAQGGDGHAEIVVGTPAGSTGAIGTAPSTQVAAGPASAGLVPVPTGTNLGSDGTADLVVGAAGQPAQPGQGGVAPVGSTAPSTMPNDTGAHGDGVVDLIVGSTITGTRGDDRLVGTGAADAITGGTGNDLLTGGAGADSFVFAKGAGHDTVTDFHIGEDHLVLQGFTAAGVTWAANGGGALVSFGDVTVQLTGIAAGSLHMTDFVFA